MPTTRITTYSYDFRGRRIATDGEVDFYEKRTYDNLNRVTRVDRHDTTSGGTLIARGETKYDDRGRVYQSIRYGVEPSTGTVGNFLTENSWYDDAGHVIKQQPAGSKLFTKTVYDGLGRRTKQYQGFDVDESTYSEADDVDGDTILEQTAVSYDHASNVVQTTHRQRYHNATGTGELNGPSGVQPKSRISYWAMWPDALGRAQATANYGTNGGSSLSRPSTIPARSDTVLVSSMSYNSAGHVATQTNAGGNVTCLQYDAVGRQVTVILNCAGGSSSSSSSSSSDCPTSDDTDVTVITAYNADGNVSSITAVNSITGNQMTQYTYGTTLSDSDIASSLLKRREIYPDSADSDDELRFKYNRQGEVKEVRDQNGTVHAYDFDKLGRQTQDRATTLGTGLNGAVRRVATSYEVRGMRQKITSWNSETVGSGSVVNEVQFAYSNFALVTHDYQAHGGAVNTSTTPKVQYGYADGSANTVRPTALTYPDGRVLTYSYGSANSMPDAVSRVAGIVDDDGSSTHLADYSYLGLSTFVKVDYTEPKIEYTLVGTAGGTHPDTGDIYRGFDRFGQIKDSYWYDYGSSTDVDRIKYGYDRNGNRLYRENTVAAAAGKSFDELYDYDLIDRLKEMGRGTLDSGHSALDTTTFAQCWSLDATGNWRKFMEDSDGDGTWSLEQTRTANKVNEIADLTESIGPSWVTPAYSRAGNMTTIPKPADPTAAYTGTYDAWNRLVRIEDGSDKVAEYEYDGAKRRTVKKTYVSGVLDETRHFYCTEPSKWQVIEERVDSASDAERQFVWGLRYVDDLVLRDRDTNGDGTLDERLYGMQDANWNVTAVANDNGSVQERYLYTAYGQTSFWNSSWDSRASSAVANHCLYTGRQFDLETAIYYYRNRYYEAQLGAFISRDPIGYEGSSWNLYEYASSNAVMFVDPFGKDRTAFCFGHAWIEVDTYDEHCNKTGTIELHFAPVTGYSCEPGNSCIYPHTLPIYYTSSCEQDRQLIELWKSLERDRKKGLVWSWNPSNNCCVPVTMFADFGGTQGPAEIVLPTVPPRTPAQQKRIDECIKNGGYPTSGGGCKYTNCFAAETIILTSSGSTTIDKVAAGDLVHSVDMESGDIVETVVLRVDQHIGNFELLGLRILGSDQVTTVWVTSDHPFLVDGRWMTAAELSQLGAVRSCDGDTLLVFQTHRTRSESDVYNLSTENGNYLVGCGALVATGRTARDFVMDLRKSSAIGRANAQVE